MDEIAGNCKPGASCAACRQLEGGGRRSFSLQLPWVWSKPSTPAAAFYFWSTVEGHLKTWEFQLLRLVVCLLPESHESLDSFLGWSFNSEEAAVHQNVRSKPVKHCKVPSKPIILNNTFLFLNDYYYYYVFSIDAYYSVSKYYPEVTILAGVRSFKETLLFHSWLIRRLR